MRQYGTGGVSTALATRYGEGLVYHGSTVQKQFITLFFKDVAHRYKSNMEFSLSNTFE